MTRLDEIRARLAAYTHGMTLRHPPGSGWLPAESARVWGELQRAAPDDLAFLLAEVERLTSERDAANALDAEHLDECAPCHPNVVRALDEARREIERLTGEAAGADVTGYERARANAKTAIGNAGDYAHRCEAERDVLAARLAKLEPPKPQCSRPGCAYRNGRCARCEAP